VNGCTANGSNLARVGDWFGEDEESDADVGDDVILGYADLSEDDVCQQSRRVECLSKE